MRLDKQVFISYSWSNKDEVEIIDKDFNDFGIILIRDVRDLNYRESIKGYMQKIKETDFALIVISDAFLKSPNCMYEAMELLQLQDFKNRILPIILSSAKIYNPIERSSYLNYWEEKVDEVETKLRQQKSIGFSDSIISEINKYRKIRNSIDNFLDHLNSHLHYSFDEMKKNEYLPIKKILGVLDDKGQIEMSPRERNAYLNGREIEKKRIGIELHDNIGVHLSILGINLGFVEEKILWDVDSEAAIKETRKTLDEIVSEIRYLSFDLSPGFDEYYSLFDAIQRLVNRLNNSGFNIKLTDNTTNFRFGTDVELKIFRIIQELISNVIRHSKASNCTIEANLVDNTLTLDINDNGIGFNLSDVDNTINQGLWNVAFRISSLNGEATINSKNGGGTKIFIKIPIQFR